MKTKPLSEELLDKEAAEFDCRVDYAFTFLSSFLRTSINMFGWGETFIALSRLFHGMLSKNRLAYESEKSSLSDLPSVK